MDSILKSYNDPGNPCVGSPTKICCAELEYNDDLDETYTNLRSVETCKRTYMNYTMIITSEPVYTPFKGKQVMREHCFKSRMKQIT